MYGDEVTSIVIDAGSGLYKAGFAGYDAPHTVIPTVVGNPIHAGDGLHHQDYYIGEEAQAKREFLSLRYPVQYGVVTNWEDMEKLWHHTFYNRLRVAPEEHPVLITEPVNNPKTSREKTTQIMFETFNTPCMYMAHQPVLSLYATARTKGIVIESGDSETCVALVIDGFTILPASSVIDFGGRDVTGILAEALTQQQGYCFDSHAEMEVARDIKEKHAYVALDFQQECKEIDDITYTLPDGQQIEVGAERIECTETLFSPNIVGLQNCVFACLTEHSPYDMVSEIAANIVLTGGSMLIPGIEDRLRKELFLMDSPTKTKVTTSNHKYSAWLGGSILASRSEFQQRWISKQEYDESGPSIIHRKCF